MDMIKLIVRHCLIAFALAVFGTPLYARDCVRRPFSDFLQNQGQTSSFFAPIPDYAGWTNSGPVTFALVDYAGLANRYLVENGGRSLHTWVTGKVVECRLPDGRAEITVKLVTANALAFAQSFDALAANEFDFLATPTVFGSKALDVLDGASPAVGPAFLETTFTISAPGEALPDLINVLQSDAYKPASVDFRSISIGRLPNGRRAQMTIEQEAAIDNVEDAIWVYTTERIDIRPVW